MQSLLAEMKKNPGLEHMTPEKADANPPVRLFPKRLKGYYKCPALGRGNVLICILFMRERGELFVKWVDPTTGQTYNGLFVLAHGFTIKYLSLCDPAVTCAFNDDGSLQTTSELVKRIRGFVVLLLHACMQVR